MKKNASDSRNLLLALIISSIILGLWQYFIEMPRKKLQAEAMRAQQTIEKTIEIKKEAAEGMAKSRNELLAESPRIPIRTDYLHGSLTLKGLRLDDLTLARYKTTLDPKSAEVVLLSPAYDKDGYFTEIGWTATNDASITLPGRETVWTADGTELIAGKPLTLTWVNPQGITFKAVLTLDDKYMFAVTQSAADASGNPVPLQTYAYLNRVMDLDKNLVALVHEGPIAVHDNVLKNYPYRNVKADAQPELINVENAGWVGITDKYWFTSLIPEDHKFTSKIESYFSKDGHQRFHVEYTSSAPKDATTLRIFAGAKELNVLDAYAKQYNIALFDRSVDFGMFYFLTKPIFHMLTFFYSIVGNFGVAILILTIIVKLVMYPLADKSYKSMAAMSALRPKMQDIQDRNKNDRQKLNQEMIELYKREKVNPASGCLPILLQIPVFISLYNALYVTIEMRHAPFYGWIKDLSAADPSNLFNLFGALEWTPPGFLHLGIWPILMAMTMYIQQRQSPPPTDPTQAQIIKYMPLFFLFLFSSVASGLVIYWTWSNVLSILQQAHIKRKYNIEHKK